MAEPADGAFRLLTDWRRRAREAQWAHYGAERRMQRSHFAIGIPLVLLTSFSGTSVFATLSTDTSTTFTTIVGLTAVAAAILGGLQTFLRVTDRAAAHRVAAGRYGSLRRTIEQELAINPDGITAETVTAIRDQLAELAEQSPPIPTRVWARTERHLAQRLAAQRLAEGEAT